MRTRVYTGLSVCRVQNKAGPISPPIAVPEGGVHGQHPTSARAHAAPDDLFAQTGIGSIKSYENYGVWSVCGRVAPPL